jgi:hypothetical protein
VTGKNQYDIYVAVTVKNQEHIRQRWKNRDNI